MALKKPVKLLLTEVRIFVANDFHLLAYLYSFIFIAAFIFINYYTGFYREVVRTSYFNGYSKWVFPLFYATMYYAVAIPTLYLRKDFSSLKKPSFYFKSSCIIVIYGSSIGYFGFHDWEFPSLFSEELRYVYRIISQLKSIFIYFIPLICYKILFDKKIEGLYGLSGNSTHIKGYFTLFFMLLPFLAVMSFTPDFQRAYPQFHPWEYNYVFNLPKVLFTGLFEITYAIDFVMTEFLFRGLLVIGMTAILGRNAILPMVSMYVAIHFGKPLGETISSVFGGFILGALAYQTRHIWGGVIVHIAIALTMEFMGFVQHYIINK